MERLVWTPDEVVDVDGPRAMLRAYLEQRDVREFCASVSMHTPIAAACDVGCGFGRLTPVLTEFAERVVGFEREAGLRRIAQSLQPSIEFRPIEILSRLPADNASFTFGLVFTVLQHVPEPEVRAVIDDLRRIVDAFIVDGMKRALSARMHMATLEEANRELTEKNEKLEIEGRGFGGGLEERVGALEQAMGQLSHFITTEMRPDLSLGALSGETDYPQLSGNPGGKSKEEVEKLREQG